MPKQIENSRVLWLGAGVIAGLCIAQFWPHEPVAAGSNDRAAKFGMMTTPMGLNIDGIFVLDYLTGHLSGVVLNTRNGAISVRYDRSVARDFKVDPKVTPQYAFVGGRGTLPSRVAPSANSILYIGELRSGKVIAYQLLVPTKGGAGTPIPLLRASFSFRPAAPKD